jgi:hypothetical protein
MVEASRDEASIAVRLYNDADLPEAVRPLAVLDLALGEPESAAGAKPPLRMPAWLGRLLAGELFVEQMTTWRGASNEKARKELAWEPRYPSWREGFRAWVSG